MEKLKWRNVVDTSNVVDELKKSEGRVKDRKKKSAALFCIFGNELQNILYQNTSMVIWLYLRDKRSKIFWYLKNIMFLVIFFLFISPGSLLWDMLITIHFNLHIVYKKYCILGKSVWFSGNTFFLRDGFRTQPPVARRFRPVSIVLNNDNHPEPDGTAGQPAVGFWSRP